MTKSEDVRGPLDAYSRAQSGRGKLRAIHLGSTHVGYRVRRSDLTLFLARPRNPQQPELPTSREPKKLAA